MSHRSLLCAAACYLCLQAAVGARTGLWAWPEQPGETADRAKSMCRQLIGIGDPTVAHECISPEQRAADIEESEFNRLLLGLVGGGMEDDGMAPLYGFFPQSGRISRDLAINNFLDLDPTPGLLTHNCDNWTYDGHTGIDCNLRSFQEQDIGVPVYAVADGVVLKARDGEPDRNTTAPPVLANRVIIAHAGGRDTWYYHLRNGSVTAALGASPLGQTVRAGQQIGLTASSGFSTGPHLHFESRQAGSAFEPFAGGCRQGPSGFVSQPVINRQLYVDDAAFTVTPFEQWPSLQEGWPHSGHLAFTDAPTTYLWYIIKNLPAHSTWRLVFIRPDSVTQYDSGDQAFTQLNDQFNRYYAIGFVNNVAGMRSIAGDWTVQFRVNGQLLVAMPITVRPTRDASFNRAPNPISAAISPAAPQTGDVITCSVTTDLVNDDPDFDIVRFTYEWKKNGQPLRTVVSAGHSDVIPVGSAVAGDVITCRVTAGDGLLSGTPVDTTANVAGAAGAPGAFSLTAPANGQTNLPTGPTLSWTASAGAESYTLVVDDDPAFQSPILTNVGIAGTGFTIPAGTLVQGVAYAWKVRAVGPGGTRDSSPATCTFTTTPPPPPGAFALASPADGATGVATNATLSWTASALAQWYTVLIDDDPLFGSPAVNQPVFDTTYTVEFGALNASTLYHWKVTSVNANGTTTASPASRSFTTGVGPAPPAAFVLVSPASGEASVGLQPAFDWADSGGASTYTLTLDDDPAFGSPVTTATGLTSSDFTYISSTLVAGQTYYWKVVAIGPGGTTSSTPASRSFTTAVQPSNFVLRYPADGQQMTPATVVLDWSDAVGATTYEVVISSEPHFFAIVYDQAGIIGSSHAVPPGVLAPNQAYYWKVLAQSSAGQTVSIPSISAFTTEYAACPEVGLSLQFSGPQNLWSAAMAYDAARGRLVVYGGLSDQSGQPGASTWLFDPQAGTWTFTMVSQLPGPRAYHSMAYDSRRGRVVLFGGRGTSADPASYPTETYEWDGAQWLLAATGGPTPRVNGAMAYDQRRGVCVLVGGSTSSPDQSTWEWDGSTWTQRVLSIGADAAPASMVYDVHRDRMVLYRSSVWEFDGQTWASAGPAAPGAPTRTAMAYDARHRSTFLFGGNVGGAPTNLLYGWDGQAWTHRPTQWVGVGIDNRQDHMMAYDPEHGRTMIFGGQGAPAQYWLMVTGCEGTAGRYSDGEFPASGWISQKVSDSTPSQAGGVVVTRPTTGGNPGAFRQVNMFGAFTGEVVAVHMSSTMVVPSALLQPSTQLQVSVDFTHLSGSTPILVWPLVRQGGVYYRGNNPTGTTGGFPWQSFTYSALGANDLTRYDFPGSVAGPLHPVFAPGTAPLELGFLTSLTVTSGNDNVTIGLENLAYTLSGVVSRPLGAVIGVQPTAPAEVHLGQQFSLTGSARPQPGATYQWYLDSEPIADGGRYSGANSGTLTVIGADPVDSGNYRLVAANAGTTAASRSAAIFVPSIAAPGPFFLNSPSGGGLNPAAVSFDWSDSAGADTYHLIVENPSWNSQVINEVGIVASQFTPGGTVLNSGTTYNWWVYAVNGGGSTLCGQGSLSFTTAGSPPPPGPFNLLLPAEGTTGVSTATFFDWSDSPGVSGYFLYIATDPAFNSVVHSQFFLPSSQFTLPSGTLNPMTTYYWRVTANNTGVTDSTPFSRSFTTGAAPAGPFNLVAPAAGATEVSRAPTFQWSASSGATAYTLMVDDDAGFGSPIINQAGLTGTTYTPAANTLAAGASYSWRVIAGGAAGNTTSTPFSATFTTAVVQGSPIPENEPNDNRTMAAALRMAQGWGVSGTSTGTLVGTGISSADYYLLSVPRNGGLTRYRLVLAPGGPNHQLSIRGLTQAAGVINPGTDINLQTSTAATNPPRMVQWYGHGGGGPDPSLFVRVSGNGTTTAPYVATLQVDPVTPTELPRSVAPGAVTISTVGIGPTTNTEVWLYDGDYTPIADLGNDDDPLIDPDTQSTLAATLTNGDYYLAVAQQNLANNLASPSSDRWRNGNVADFGGVTVCSVSGFGADLSFTVVDSAGTQSVSAQSIEPYGVLWYHLHVGAVSVPGCSPADIASEGSADPLAGPDGFVTGVDFDVFVLAYFTELRRASGVLVADLTDGTGIGGPDGFVTGTDFDRFVQLYFAGC